MSKSPSVFAFPAVAAAVALIFAACSGGSYSPTQSGGGSGALRAEQKPASPGESTFFAFPSQAAGRVPNAPGIFDSQGDLFGSTYAGGGPADDGTIYELTPGPFGLSEHLLYRFNPNSPPGINPGPISMDSSGDIFGAASQGVFKLRKTKTGAYVMQLIYKCFQGNGSNHDPEVTLVTDSLGRTDVYAACSSAAILLQPSNFGNGYSETTLHIFQEGGGGINVNGGLAVDSAGDVFGTTTYSGSMSRGSVFRLHELNVNDWALRVIRTFGGAGDGAYPWAGLSMDSGGNLYGTTTRGGVDDRGTVYQLAPNPDGATYTETILDNPSQSRAVGRPLLGSGGDIYFTATGGPDTVFKLTPSGGGYMESTLFQTVGPLTDDSLFSDSAGAIYGTTVDGGKGCPSQAGCGFIYKIVQ